MYLGYLGFLVFLLSLGLLYWCLREGVMDGVGVVKVKTQHSIFEVKIMVIRE